MDNQTRHVYTDVVCVGIMFIGFVFAIFTFFPLWIGVIITSIGLGGMFINEKINPFDAESTQLTGNLEEGK